MEGNFTRLCVLREWKANFGFQKSGKTKTKTTLTEATIIIIMAIFIYVREQFLLLTLWIPGQILVNFFILFKNWFFSNFFLVNFSRKFSLKLHPSCIQAILFIIQLFISFFVVVALNLRVGGWMHRRIKQNVCV